MFDASEEVARTMLGKHALTHEYPFLVRTYGSLRNNTALYKKTSFHNNTFPHDKAFLTPCFVKERGGAKPVGCDDSATRHRPTKSSVAPLSRLPSPTGLPLLASSHS